MNSLRIGAIVVGIGVLLCSIGDTGRAEVATRPARYLAAWTGDEDVKDSDFLAVLDVTPREPEYGRVIASAPVGLRALEPHHTEHVFDPGGILFGSGWSGDKTFRFDLRDPLRPKVLGELTPPADVHFLHSFVRLPNHHVLATFQGEGRDREGAGGLVEFDEAGAVVRRSSARTNGIDPTMLRPYSLAVVPQLNRVVTGSNPMNFPADWPDPHIATMRQHVEHEGRGHHVQVWRLSDLALLATLPVPDEGDGRAAGPNEPRLLQDGKTVLVPTVEGALLKVEGLDDQPSLRRVYAFDAASRGGSPGVNTPAVIGNYWIQTIRSLNTIVALDVRDPEHPKEASRLRFADTNAHWVSADEAGSRLVVVGTAGEPRVWIVNIDLSTGALSIDTRFRNPGSSKPGFTFALDQWPHGPTGAGRPHGMVFVP